MWRANFAPALAVHGENDFKTIKSTRTKRLGIPSFFSANKVPTMFVCLPSAQAAGVRIHDARHHASVILEECWKKSKSAAAHLMNAWARRENRIDVSMVLGSSDSTSKMPDRGAFRIFQVPSTCNDEPVKLLTRGRTRPHKRTALRR